MLRTRTIEATAGRRTAVSPACDHCYAEALSRRTGGPVWGKGQPRRHTSAHTWKQPLAWNRKAAKLGVRRRVFCASLADVFDTEVPDAWRDELFALIAETPHLDWLLLTKRPKAAHDYAATVMRTRPFWPDGREGVTWPLPNVWLGTTVENQAMADARIPWLLKTPTAVRFLSMEPLLGAVDLFRVRDGQFTFNALSKKEGIAYRSVGLDWVIVGGESGVKARPSHPGWFRSIRDQCAAAGVPFLFKQWGEYASVSEVEGPGAQFHFPDGATVRRVGKDRAGRTLDGVEHNAFPMGSGEHRS